MKLTLREIKEIVAEQRGFLTEASDAESTTEVKPKDLSDVIADALHYVLEHEFENLDVSSVLDLAENEIDVSPDDVLFPWRPEDHEAIAISAAEKVLKSPAIVYLVADKLVRVVRKLSEV